MKRIRLYLVALLLALLPSATIYAQTSGPGQALEISPPVYNAATDPGKTLTINLSLRNITRSDLVVNAQFNDFVASGEDGTPKILLDEEEAEDNPYSIKDWVRSIPELVLVPREVKTMPVTIDVPQNASPGGHYGVIRFTAKAPNLRDSGVSLSASLGTLVLLNVNGATEEKLEIEELTILKNGQAGTFFETAPLTFVERVKNSGNTHSQPAGQVQIRNMFGKKIAALNVNLPPRNILPGSIRRFEQPLDHTVLGTRRLFGRYTASLELTYGDGQKVTRQVVFWVVPWKLIAIVITLLIVAFFVLRNGLKRYNKHIIEKSKRR